MKKNKISFIVKCFNDKVLTPTLYACYCLQTTYSNFEDYIKAVKQQIEKNNNKL